MQKHNLGWNWNGTQTQIHVDDNEIITTDVQTARANQAIIDRNQRLRALGKTPNRAAHGRIAASIPITVYQTWRKEWQTTHRDTWTWKTYLSMKLNSRDYSYLKTREGTI